MMNPSLILTTLLFTASDHLSTTLGSAQAALSPSTTISQTTPIYLSSERERAAAERSRWPIHGRVRWSAQRVIIEWQTKQEATAGGFAIYRSRNILWREAILLDLSIFATSNSQTGFVSYRAVDTTAIPPGPYFYWIVKLSAKQGEQHFGPYIGQVDNTLEF